MGQLYIEYKKNSRTTDLLQEREYIKRSLASASNNQQIPDMGSQIEGSIVLTPNTALNPVSVPTGLVLGTASVSFSLMPGLVSSGIVPVASLNYDDRLNSAFYSSLPQAYNASFPILDQAKAQKPMSTFEKLRNEINTYREACGESLSVLDDDDE